MTRRLLRSAAGAASLMPAASLATVGEADFSLDSTRDLYDLCSASSDRPDYAQAIYSCRASLEATVRYHDAVGGDLVDQHKRGHIG